MSSKPRVTVARSREDSTGGMFGLSDEESQGILRSRPGGSRDSVHSSESSGRSWTQR